MGIETHGNIYNLGDSLNAQITPIGEIIGKIIIFRPQTLINRGRLFASQASIDPHKLKKALCPELWNERELPISGLVSDEVVKGKLVRVITIGEGHHRLGIATLSDELATCQINGIYSDNFPRWGFNKIIQLITQATGQK